MIAGSGGSVAEAAVPGRTDVTIMPAVTHVSADLKIPQMRRSPLHHLPVVMPLTKNPKRKRKRGRRDAMFVVFVSPMKISGLTGTSWSREMEHWSSMG
jgi:hypothetical protein